jgi:hypothetical protein
MLLAQGCMCELLTGVSVNGGPGRTSTYVSRLEHIMFDAVQTFFTALFTFSGLTIVGASALAGFFGSAVIASAREEARAREKVRVLEAAIALERSRRINYFYWTPRRPR